ncbi:MAG: glycoside hydrolase family 172 protein [Promethearchaeota archaeon]
MARNGLHVDFEDDDIHALPYLKDYRILQVSTHGHDRPIPGVIKSWRKFKGTMHRDQVSIPPRGEWAFDTMEGPGKIVNIWCTIMPPVDFDPFAGGETRFGIRDVLRNVGQLRRIIPFHRFPHMLKALWINIYFDGESVPSVDAPVGDFFGVGFGEYKHYQSRYLMMTAGGYVCQFHMPFKKSARVVLVNKHPEWYIPAFYGAVTYARYRDASPLENQGYFHAAYRTEYPTTEGKPYLVLDTREMGPRLADKPGHYVGVVLNTEATNRKSGFTYLEGNTKVWVDDEEVQGIEYTGLEDYYQGAWYYTRTKNRRRTEFSAPYHGVTVISFNRWGAIVSNLLSKLKKCRVSQYRFHPEGIPFERNIRVSSHHGEFDEVEGNYSSVAYWYQKH